MAAMADVDVDVQSHARVSRSVTGAGGREMTSVVSHQLIAAVRGAITRCVSGEYLHTNGSDGQGSKQRKGDQQGQQRSATDPASRGHL